MYVCMYVCIYIHICIYAYMYMHIYIYIGARHRPAADEAARPPGGDRCRQKS